MNSSTLISLINQRLESQKLVLPSLPDIAIEVSDKLKNDPNIEIQYIGSLIKKDAAIAASVIRFANSALVKGTVKVDSIEKATVRIGLKRLKNIIMGFAIEQMFFARELNIAMKLSDAWRLSSEVATSAGATLRYLQDQGIATNLDLDTMFLTSLVHNIGYLPVLTELDELAEQYDKDMITHELIYEIGMSTGIQLNKIILTEWEFDNRVISAASQWPNLDFDTDEVCYLDILRLSMTRMSCLDPDLRKAFLKKAIDREIIRDDSWYRSGEFSLYLENYQGIFN